MDDFSRAAFAWSETRPVVSLRAATRSQAGRGWLAPATWAMAAAVVLAAGVPMVIHHDRQPSAPANAAVVDGSAGSDDSEAQIAEDNQLMRSVNMAIGVNDSSALRGYGLQTGRRARLKTVSGLRSE
jgi:hypothetical protein